MAEVITKQTVDNPTAGAYGVAVSSRGPTYGEVQLQEMVYAGESGDAPVPVHTLGSPTNSAVVTATTAAADAITADDDRKFIIFTCTSGTVFLGPTGVTATSFFHTMSAGDPPFIVDRSSGAMGLWRCITASGTATIHCGAVV